MTKTIDTLTEDIYYVLDHTEEHDPSSELAASYAMRIGGEFAKSTLQRTEPREKGKMWASDLGKPCMRQHWYKWNMPEAGTKLMGHTKFKFLYGNILEEAVLYLAEEAGHKVEHTQERVETEFGGWTVSGRIDAVIDGVLVDVKSTSSYGFQRYKDGIDNWNDSFGYLYQLGFYQKFIDDDKWHPNNKVGFVWIDKQNGHIKYTEASPPSYEEIRERVHNIIAAVETKDELDVPKYYKDEPYGKSGNKCLSMSCSYCDFKKQCWPGLRTFAYNHKPVHFTEIKREPKVPEIKDD